MSKAERLLSYSLLSLITSKPLASGQSPHIPGIAEEDEDEDESITNSPSTNTSRSKHRFKGKGLMNEDGAWCWREGCQECLSLTKSIQRTSETLQSVADMYDDHVCVIPQYFTVRMELMNLFLSQARRTQLATHESLKGVAHPSPIYEGIVSTHRSTLTRYRDASREGHVRISFV